MTFLELVRLETGLKETVGTLLVNKKVFGFVLEPGKLENKVGVSCIPTGQYICKKYYSEKYKTDCLSLFDVPGRSYIAIHYGNTAIDTKGCLLVGSYTGYLGGERAVLCSKDTLKDLVGQIEDNCHLTITENF